MFCAVQCRLQPVSAVVPKLYQNLIVPKITGTPTLGNSVQRARIALRTKFFLSLLSSEGAFSGIVDSLVQENLSGDKPPDPQTTIVLLGDQYTKHCSSGKEFEDQNLPVWRSIHIHRYALRGRLVPPALGSCRRP